MKRSTLAAFMTMVALVSAGPINHPEAQKRRRERAEPRKHGKRVKHKRRSGWK